MEEMEQRQKESLENENKRLELVEQARAECLEVRLFHITYNFL